MSLIKPTVGRKVWFRGTPFDTCKRLPLGTTPALNTDGMLDATILATHGDRCVNVDVIDANGIHWFMSSVILRQEGDDVPTSCYVEWMPFQMGQAKKEVTDPESHASKVLYPAIQKAMNTLQSLPQTLGVSAALTTLHGAFWSETPAPAGKELTGTQTKIYSDGTMATGPGPLPEKSPVEAPRITLNDIHANIASEYYFTAGDGVGAVTGGGIVTGHKYPGPLDTLTLCVLVLCNGFIVTGESRPVSEAKFDAEIGRKMALDNAIAKIWPLMGYQLKQELYQASRTAFPV